MESISNNTLPELSSVKRHRRRHSPTFKAEVLAACDEPGASIAAVAQRYQVNVNLVHKQHIRGQVSAASKLQARTKSGWVTLPTCVSVTSGAS
jgi:transposase